ncbi:hypothetical protein BC831DRAFT_438485 [Entophlyctis helioformis]|nr:hypothetical protein BC831DRAFT_438485 [Entophlyctis helioformis]
MLVSGIVHVDALSIFYGTLRKLAASHLPSSVSGWLAILAPVLDSFLKSVGNSRIVVFHVDGRLAKTGIKQQAHASRTLDVLRAAATAQQLCAKRKDRRRCGALEKKEEQALMRCFTLTQGDKKHIKEAIEAFLDPLSYHAVCWCEHEADVCIARNAAEYASQPSNVLPLAVITGDSDLVFHCAGRCGVLMTRMHNGHATNIRTFNHQGVATIAAALGLRVFPGVCQLFAAIANNDYHSCHGCGNAAAVKFINDQFDAVAKERGFDNPADFCALLHDPKEADAFANRVKNAYVADLLLLDGGVALAKSFLNAFGVFVYHDESGTFANTVTFPTSDSSQSGNVPKKRQVLA